MEHAGPIKVIVYVPIGRGGNKIYMPNETSDNRTIYPLVIAAIITV